MLWRDVIELVSVTWSEDEFGFPIEIKTERQAFANKKAVRQSEFYQAAMAGLKPELMFEVRSAEYRGEQTLIYEGKEYTVLRTYDKSGEVMELVCTGLVSENAHA